ncbi:MAG: ABC transporter ATP-binding protein [Lentisphaeria bacterium]|nr:ABC transporter ATP-binding protein [Lentisphaeria bacterium]
MSEPEVILQAEHVCKQFTRICSDYGLKDVLLHSFSFFYQHLNSREFRALDDISFTLKRGESLAILGANGAGKSTLLSLIGGIIRPTSGELHVNGRIGLMLELGSGFCHDLSGRENIMLNGLLLGATRREIRDLTDEIIDFSGLRDFIDEPLRTYSTGMQTRLGFAIAVHLKPDIMLIDEVLAVGDSEFRRKCQQKLAEMKQDGVVCILVTHALEHAENYCERAIYLDHGKIVFSGETRTVTDAIRKSGYEY